jgi:hypothetical protein
MVSIGILLPVGQALNALAVVRAATGAPVRAGNALTHSPVGVVPDWAVGHAFPLVEERSFPAEGTLCFQGPSASGAL